MRKHFYISDDDAIRIIENFQALHNITKATVALEKLIKEAEHNRLYLSYFLTHRDASKEEPECLRRILYLGVYYCCKNAPRITELPTLDICKACKWQIVVWSKKADKELKRVEPKKAVKEVWCKSGGLYVVKECCDRCNEPCEKKALFNGETD